LAFEQKFLCFTQNFDDILEAWNRCCGVVRIDESVTAQHLASPAAGDTDNPAAHAAGHLKGRARVLVPTP